MINFSVYLVMINFSVYLVMINFSVYLVMLQMFLCVIWSTGLVSFNTPCLPAVLRGFIMLL